MCMKPCANTKQICSWQLWARTSILVFSALLPRLPALEEYLGFRSPPPSSLPFLSSQKGEVRYSPNSCKREQRLQRRSGSDTHTHPPPPRPLCPPRGGGPRSPGGSARRRGAARSSAALLCPPATRRRRRAGQRRAAAALGGHRRGWRGELYGPGEVSGPTACFSGAARGGWESWPPWGDRRKDGKNASL